MKPFANLFQYHRITTGATVADQAQARSNQNRTDLRILEEKVDSLSLICQAMWELLEDSGFSNQQLIDKIEAIDLRDGKLDGNINKVTHCPECSHKLGKRHNQCFWCGAIIEANNFVSNQLNAKK